MFRHFGSKLLGGALFATFAIALAVAQSPPPGSVSPEKASEDKRKAQEQNAKIFKDLSRRLLELAIKLDKSERPEDKDRAKTIRAALEVAEKAGVENQFRALMGGMGSGTRQIQDLERLIGQDEELTRTLKEMLTILQTDDETARLKAEIARLEKFMKEAEDLKRREEQIRAMTESRKGDLERIAKNQNDVAAQTKDLADRMAGKKGGDSGKKPNPADTKAESKDSEPKDGEKASETKADSQGSKSESKDGDAKAGSEAKPGKGEPKAGSQAKPGEKNGEAKPAEPKEAKAPKAEPAKPKDQGEGKGEAKPSKGAPGEGKGKGASGAPKDAQANSKSGGSGGPQSPQPPQPQQPQNNTPGRKAVEEAYPHQKGAEDDVRKDKRDEGSKKMDKAVEELAKAIEEMKKRLKQLREEEMMKLLANLEARCNRMLAMQIEVWQNTKAIHAGILQSDSKVATTGDIQKSQQQSDREREIIAEAEKTLKLLETEGSAVAFASVLEEVMGDMQAVQLRLEKAIVDNDTQAIEENIIAMLKDMVAALKKQQQDMQDKKNNPPPPGNNKPNQKLIDQLAELRLIRALQSQVNSRTIMYGKKSGGEQAADQLIQNELRQLATRQEKLQDMIRKIATGANQ